MAASYSPNLAAAIARRTITWQDSVQVTVLEASRRRVNRVRLERIRKEMPKRCELSLTATADSVHATRFSRMLGALS